MRDNLSLLTHPEYIKVESNFTWQSEESFELTREYTLYVDPSLYKFEGSP